MRIDLLLLLFNSIGNYIASPQLCNATEGFFEMGYVVGANSFEISSPFRKQFDKSRA